jgi:hypothetical protein
MVVVVGGLTDWLAGLACLVDGGAGSFAGAEAWMKEGWEGRVGRGVGFGGVRRMMCEEDSCCVDRKRRGKLFLASFNLFTLFVFWRVVSAILLPLSEGIPLFNLRISLSFLSLRTFFRFEASAMLFETDGPTQLACLRGENAQPACKFQYHWN